MVLVLLLLKVKVRSKEIFQKFKYRGIVGNLARFHQVESTFHADHLGIPHKWYSNIH